MDKIKAIVSQHKKTSLLALFVLIVFVGFSVTSAMNVAQRRAEEESIEQVEPDNEKTSSSESDKDIKLSDSQKEAIKGYDDKVKRLIETMSSSIWSDKTGTNTLRFYDTYYVETINGVEKTHPYAITKVEWSTARMVPMLKSTPWSSSRIPERISRPIQSPSMSKVAPYRHRLSPPLLCSQRRIASMSVQTRLNQSP